LSSQYLHLQRKAARNYKKVSLIDHIEDLGADGIIILKWSRM
jgi:hypothetical protein